MHVEIERGTDETGDDVLTADLERVLRDVREAVEDWPKMRATALRIAEEIADQPSAGLPEQEVAEATELLRWLADDHFTFMGYREYVLDDSTAPEPGDGSAGRERLVAVAGTGLGILRADQTQGRDVGRLPREASDRARQRQLLVITKANSRSTVHRPAYLDYVGVKVFDEQGAVVGERRFLGLFTSAAYNESIQEIPVLRRKATELLARLGFSKASHSGKDLVQILETYPRDELFQISGSDLARTALAVLHLQERRQLRLFLRRDDYGRFMSCMVYLPRDRYTTHVRQEMEDILLDAFDGVSIDYAALVSESVLARLHFVVRVDAANPIRDVDPAAIEERLVLATRSWDDDFSDALAASCSPEQASVLTSIYAEAFPEAYKEALPADAAVADIHRLEALQHKGDIDLALYTPHDALPNERRLKLFHVGEPVSLSLVLPRLQEMGVEVVDERPYLIARAGGPAAWVYDFGLRYEPSGEGASESGRFRFQDAFAAVWAGEAESDGFNALVLRAGLTWRQAMVLRAYAKYLRQGGSTFSQNYIEECLTSNVHIARLLVRLFEARLDPGFESGGRRGRSTVCRKRSMAPSTPSRASTRTASCDRSSVPSERRCAPTISSPTRTAGPSPTSPSSSTPTWCPTSRNRCPASRSGSTALASRACTCASVRSLAGACAGRTVARTSAPRCSGWSRRRWSRTPSSFRSAPRAGSSSSAHRRRRATRPPTARRCSPRASRAIERSSAACSTSPTTASTTTVRR